MVVSDHRRPIGISVDALLVLTARRYDNEREKVKDAYGINMICLFVLLHGKYIYVNRRTWGSASQTVYRYWTKI